MLPSIPQAAQNSWFSSINLRQSELPELDITAFPELSPRPVRTATNAQSADVFSAEQRYIEEIAAPVAWRRPSDHDLDRLGDPLEGVVVAEALAEHPDVVGAGALRGIILHKLMEEFLTGELTIEKPAAVARAAALLSQLVSALDEERPLPLADEMAATALQGLALPEIAILRPYLVPEVAVWAARNTYLVGGRADALAVREGRVEVAIDWKSDVDPAPSVRAAYRAQLRDYLEATGASRGAIVFLTFGEVTWVESESALQRDR